MTTNNKPVITINGRFLSQKTTGVQRYAMETLKALQAAAKTSGFDIKVIAPQNAEDALADSVGAASRGIGRGHLWEQFSLPFFTKGVLVNFCNTYPLLARKQLVVIHDASVYAVPEGYTKAFVFAYKALFSALRLRGASVRVITDSEFSRQQIAKHVGIAASNISVVYCGADHWKSVIPAPELLERLGISGKRFLLGVGSANRNKNLERLIEGYQLLARPDIPLVLVGGSNSKIFASNAQVQVPGIIRAGYVTDAELAALYAAAYAFIFPSLYEGFGLPPLEAMTFGCPVIVSGEASLPEVCGDAAIYCDAYDPQSIADCMHKILDEPTLRAQMSKLSLKRAAMFSWNKTAADLSKVIKNMNVKFV